MTTIDPELRTWVESVLGRSVVDALRPATGGSRLTWLVELDGEVLPKTVVLRTEGSGSFAGTELSLAREAVAFQALAGSAIPVPEVLAVRADGQAMILERLAGTDDLASLSSQQRRSAMDHFASILVALHGLNPRELTLPGFPLPESPEDHALYDLATWARLAAGVAELDPLLGYCAGWLHSNAPTTVRTTSFVHGDAGPGNFLADAGVVTGLVDMEFCYIGDPVNDVAWAMMRLGDGDDAASFLATYERLGGFSVDMDALAYYRLMVDYRCAVTTSLAVSRGGGARGLGPYLMITQRYFDGVAKRLARLSGIGTQVIDAQTVEATARTPMFDQLVLSAKAAARASADAAVQAEFREGQILLHYLRAYDRIGEAVLADDLRDRRATLDADVDDASLRLLAREAGVRCDQRMLEYLVRRSSRQHLLWATLLDR